MYVQLFGYIASALVLATFWQKAPLRLRKVGVASNLAFITYGLTAHLIPLTILHAILLPLNITRLIDLQRLTRKVQHALTGDLSMDWLRPFMRPRNFSAGDFLFRKGDPQTDVFYVLAGTIRLTEIDVAVQPGELLGEMGVFSPTHDRSLSAECETDVEVLCMSTEELLKLYYQDTRFGFYLVRLITKRLLQDSQILGKIISERTEHVERLRALTDVDEITGLSNQRALLARLGVECSRASRTSAPLSVIVIEIEDAHNRRWADERLIAAAVALSSCASRASDTLARYQNAFVAILPDTNAAAADVLAQEMRSASEAISVPSDHVVLGDLRAFTGVATRVPDRAVAPETLLEDAYCDLRAQRSVSNFESLVDRHGAML